MWKPLTIKFNNHSKENSLSRISQSIQFRFTFFIVGVFAISLLIFSIPIVYYINYNYDLFIELAYDSTPNIVEQLEREKFWINQLLISSVIASLGVLSIIVFRLLSQMDHSLQIVKSKLRSLSYGQWNCGAITIKENKDFSEIFSLYNHLYHFNREIQNQEIECILSLQLSIDHPKYHAWLELINSKRSLMGLEEVTIISSDAFASEAPNSRHAS